MTVDDYKLLANAMHRAKPVKYVWTDSLRHQYESILWDIVVLRIGEACKQDNCFFEPEFFRNACNNGVK